MSGYSNMAVWKVLKPSSWPKAPRWMSFSTLLELELCPRRWALCTADYPSVWDQRGYPSLPQTSALEGTVVHLALEKISHAFSERGCCSLIDESAFYVLKDLCGFTVIIADCIERALGSYEGNPRATPILEGVRQGLVAKIPKLRTQVQRLLSRVTLAPRAAVPLNTVIRHTGATRNELPHGSHAEVKLQVPELSWYGVGDLVTLSDDFCEIRDFKTGIPKPQHEFQLRTYALLWARDRDLNPSCRLADKLVLSYDEFDIQVPAPREEDMCFLEDEVRRRTDVALTDLQRNPPDTRPSQESCRYCTVRHFCDEYWKWCVRQQATGESSQGHFTDLQIRLADRHGPASWDGTVECSSAIKVGRSVLLRTSYVPLSLSPGQRIRLLNIYLSISEDDWVEGESGIAVATMGASTEVS